MRVQLKTQETVILRDDASRAVPFPGGSEMGALIAAHDWAATPLGPIGDWPVALRNAVDLVLGCPVAMSVFWGEDLIQIYNDAYAVLARDRHPHALGQPTHECWPEGRDMFEPTYRGLLHGTLHRVPTRRITSVFGPLGAYYQADVSCGPLRDDAGGIGGVLVLVADVTAEVRAERRIAGWIENRRRLFQQAPGFICVTASRGHAIEFCNTSFERLVGRGDLAGKTVRMALPDHPWFDALLDEAYARRSQVIRRHVAIPVAQPDGTVEQRFVDFICAPAIDDDGRITGIVTQGMDVTEAHRAREVLLREERRIRDVNADLERRITLQDAREAEIQAQKAQLRTIIEAAPTAIIVLDEQGTILEFNPAAEHLWAHAAPDVIGASVMMLSGPEEHDRIRAMVAYQPKPGETGVGVPSETAFALTRDGRRVPVEVNVGRASTPAGNLTTLFCRDISSRVMAEQRRSELGATLAHVTRERGMSELAADLAHELNQPLSATVNFLASARILASRGGQDERVVEMLALGEEQLLRSGEIIRRLRDFLAKRETEMRAESVASVVREAVELVAAGMIRYATRIETVLDPAAGQVFVDRIQMQQVLVSLLHNAMAALHDAPESARVITIESRPAADDMVEIAVSDTGAGIPATLHDELYARFSTTSSGTTAGIGLSISRRIVEAHGGTLVAQARPEGGAVFRFTMPAARRPRD